MNVTLPALLAVNGLRGVPCWASLHLRDQHVTSEGADTVSLRGYVNPIEVVRESLSRITGQIYDTMRADELAFYDANPVRLDLLLSSEDYRVLYLDLSGEQLGTLGTYLDGEPVTGTVSVEVEVRFSLFNAVRIEMPTA